MTPFVLEEGEGGGGGGGHTIFINRGWIPNSIAMVPTFFATEQDVSAHAARSRSPVVTVEAIVDKGESKQTFVPDNESTAPFRRYFWLDLPTVAA